MAENKKLFFFFWQLLKKLFFFWQLLKIDGVKSVLFGEDFITITKQNETDEWALIKPNVFAILMDYLQSGKPIFNEEFETNNSLTDTSFILF